MVFFGNFFADLSFINVCEFPKSTILSTVQLFHVIFLSPSTNEPAIVLNAPTIRVAGCCSRFSLLRATT